MFVNNHPNAALDIVSQCGIPISLVGSYYLARAIELRADKFLKLNCIYSHIAGEYSVSCKSVSRAIRYAISRSDDIRDHLSAICGHTVKKEFVFNGFVISALSKKFCSL